MKIPLLLVQYLYKNRKMSLPGLGIFTLDKSVVLPEENDRVLLSMPNAVQFQNANIASAEKDLIAFIVQETGKITPLAISDLDSYLSLGTEMLNIGKPFHLEGIGTITKNKNGKFDFTPGEYTLIKENTGGHEQEHGKKKSQSREKNTASHQAAPRGNNLLKFLALLAAIAIVGYGGWMMYKRNSLSLAEKNTDTNTITPVQTPTVSDSLAKSATQLDSIKSTHIDSVHPARIHSGDSSSYKFIILQTADKARALKRYNQLLSFDLKIHMAQKDSTLFKVYFQFPAIAKDTIHIKDSLRKEYAHDVLIEQ